MEQPCRLKPAGHFYTSAIYFPIFPLSLFPSHNMFFKKGKYTIPQKVDTLKQGKTAARPEIVDTQGGVKTQTVDIFRTGINLV